MIFSETQKRHINNILSEKSTKRKRILGVAGTGKTLMVSHCVREIIKKRKRVLVCYYTKSLNIKMLDLIKYNFKNKNDFQKALVNLDSLTPDPIIINYHRFMYNYIGEWFDDSSYEGYELQDDTTAKLFDYIFVDEMQDLKPNHIKNLIMLLKPSGKICIFADKYQRIFDNNSYENEEDALKSFVPKLPKGVGFSGPWVHLKEVFRSNSIIEKKAQEYVEKFLKEKYGEEEFLYPGEEVMADIEYFFFEGNACLKRLPRLLEYIKNLEEEDLQNTIILTCTQLEACIVNEMLEDACIKCFSMFHFDNKRKPREIKANFDINNPGVKISTVHSFKGHEMPICIYLYKKEAESGKDWTPELEYVALSRATRKMVIFNYDEKNNLHNVYKDFLKETVHGIEFEVTM